MKRIWDGKCYWTTPTVGINMFYTHTQVHLLLGSICLVIIAFPDLYKSLIPFDSHWVQGWLSFCMFMPVMGASFQRGGQEGVSREA